MLISRSLESVESLVRISDEGQAHLRSLFVGYVLRLLPVCSAVVFLWDLFNREIADVDVRGKLGFKGCSDLAKLLPNYAGEERVLLNGTGPTMSSAIFAQSIIGITEETMAGQ